MRPPFSPGASRLGGKLRSLLAALPDAPICAWLVAPSNVDALEKLPPLVGRVWCLSVVPHLRALDNDAVDSADFAAATVGT